jgi:hypothetical protein
MKASFIFDHTFFSQKPDLLFPRISEFIQKYFLPCGESIMIARIRTGNLSNSGMALHGVEV